MKFLAHPIVQRRSNVIMDKKANVSKDICCLCVLVEISVFKKKYSDRTNDDRE